MKLRTWIQWWLLDRRQTRRECAALRKSLREMRQANWTLQEKLFVANRDRLDALAKVDHMATLWVHEGSQWRDQLNSVLVWLGRVATGFGPGDEMPKRELVEADTVSHSKLSPQDAIREIIRRAQHNG